jgi:hypothetical protein
MGIAVNEETGEGVVELYLRHILIYPVPNTLPQFPFKFDIPQTLLISRRESLADLERKIQRVFNNRLFQRGEKGIMVNKMRLWKSMVDDMDEIKDIEKKWKNSSVVRVDAMCLTPMEETKKATIMVEDLPFAEAS